MDPSRLAAAADVSWYDMPGVRAVGAIAGVLFLLVAIRSMFGRK